MLTAQNFFSFFSNRLYLAGLFLLPTIVVFSFTMPTVPLKMTVATVAFVAALVLTILGAFKRGALSLPLSLIIGAVWLIPLAYLVSGLLGPSFTWSLIGGGLDMDTVFFAALSALAVSLPLAVFEKRADVMRALIVLLVASWLVSLFHLVRLFVGPEALSFGVMVNPLFSPIGKWNDLAIFSGLIGILSLVLLESLDLKRVERYVLMATLVVALFFIAVINFVPVWVALGLTSFAVLVYKFILAPREHARFSVASTVVFVVALVAIIFSTSIGSSLGRTFGVEQIEARPSWSSTFEVAKATLSDSPLTGSGPNTFLLEWDKHRPTLINESIFWNADFTSGVGMLPTAAVTTGLVGSLAWLLFIVLFVMAGVRGLMLRAPQDIQATSLMMATFVGGLYMLAMAVVYLPSPQLVLVGFVIIGMFVALYHKETGGKVVAIDFRERPRIGFVAVLGLSLTLVGSVLAVYGVGTSFVAAQNYEQAARAAQVDGDFDRALAHVTRSTSYLPNDQTYRLQALIHLAQLNQVVNTSASATAPSQDAQQKFQQSLGAAVESALAAVRFNQENYRNWATLASAYQSVVPLNVDGSYEAAVNALDRARVLNPVAPTVPMSLAQLDVAKGKTETAKKFIEEALALKQDYTPALTLLAQLELESGNLDRAIERAEAASVFEPSNAIFHFQVGVLKFEKKDYQGAGEALTRALTIAPEYSNARYYLGRTYVALKDFEKALVEFNEVLRLNPENQEVMSVITSLEAGKDPFAPTKR